jgi:hypothetical protein
MAKGRIDRIVFRPDDERDIANGAPSMHFHNAVGLPRARSFPHRLAAAGRKDSQEIDRLEDHLRIMSRYKRSENLAPDI